MSHKGAVTPEQQALKASNSCPNTPDTDGNESHSDSDSSNSSAASGRARVAHGVLADGTHFAVPETESVLHALFSAKAWMTPFQWVWVGSILLTFSTLYFYKVLPSWFYIAQCIFWRMGYNFGLGFVLNTQSKTRGWEKICKNYIFNSPTLVKLIERCVLFIDPTVKRFSMKDYPSEFSSWLTYRFVVKVVLALDVSGYIVLVLLHFIYPTVDGTWDTEWLAFGDISATLWARYIAFFVLFVFAIWSKSDAHRVLGDYAWYWGDFWFLLEKDLVFDGIFQMFPHPMYTVGYSFIYGCSLASRGFTVFFCSVVSHLMQMFFLAVVENPHIDKTYNVMTAPTPVELERDQLLYGETTVRTTNQHGNQVYELPYFERNELIYLRNFDVKRSFDWILAAFVVYSSLTGLVMGSWAKDMTDYSGFGPISGGLLFCVVQAVVWRLIGTFVIGYILRRQSTEGWWVSLHQGNTHLAFQHWKTLYNTINTMGIVSYVVVILRCLIQHWYSPAEAIAAGSDSLLVQILEAIVDLTDPSSRGAVFVVGVLLCLINLYVSDGVFDAIGPFGYFYSDFFIKNVPTSTLTYNGIYRYLNNPDTNLGFAGYYGLVLLCPKHTIWVALPLAVFAHLCAKFFQVWVEEPHMRRRYSPEQLRKEGGLHSEIKRRARGVRTAMKKKKTDVEASIEKLQKELKEKTQQRDQINTSLKKSKSQQDLPTGGANKRSTVASSKSKKEQ